MGLLPQLPRQDFELLQACQTTPTNRCTCPQINTMTDLDFLSIAHHGDASPDFWADVVTKQDDHPKIRLVDCDGSVWPVDNEVLQLTLLSVSVETKKCCCTMQPSHVLCMILMDGSETVCKAYTDTSLGKHFDNVDDIKPGSTIIVKDYSILWLEPENGNNWNAVMLIKKLSHRGPPEEGKPRFETADDGEDYQLSDQVTSVHPLVVSTAGLGHVIFTTPSCLFDKKSNQRFVYNNFLTQSQMMQGYSVIDLETREGWKGVVKKKQATAAKKLWDREDDGIPGCGCQCLPYKFQKCVCTTLPVEDLDLEAVFLSITALMSEDQLVADTFEGLPASKKRWCLYHWYTLNVFSLFGSVEQQKLPACLENHVRCYFPEQNVRGDFASGDPYTGFKHSLGRDSYPLKSQIKKKARGADKAVEAALKTNLEATTKAHRAAIAAVLAHRRKVVQEETSDNECKTVE